MIVIATSNPAGRRTTAVAEAGTLLLEPLAREIAHRLEARDCPSAPRRSGVVGATLLALP
ncbi:hypothetical protein [Amycolatopsis sp. A1MSW2902]|uniref:hypothetical protein n=1 Tax=Amycolatopsis sp. A1MSW2902 TaxID=687413 RepID=UPI00307E5FB8